MRSHCPVGESKIRSVRKLPAMTDLPFNSPYAYGFVRTAVATPRVRVADPRHNGQQVLDLAQAAADDHAALVLFRAVGLLQRGPVLPGCSARRRAGSPWRPCATNPATRAYPCRRSTAARLTCPLQLRRGAAPRTTARGGAQILSAELPRILRETALRPCSRRSAEDRQSSGGGRAPLAPTWSSARPASASPCASRPART